MGNRNKIQFREVMIWLKDQLSHPKTLFKRKSWGVFSEYSHIRRSDRRPKIASHSKEKALEVAKSMEEKYGGKYSIYKCLYCNGWHVAKEAGPIIHAAKETYTAKGTVSKDLDIEKILKTGIPDIAPVYGGVRGRTMSSLHQSFAWPIIKEAGIHTVIDLREDGVYSRLSDLCSKYGMEYFYYPIDKKCKNIESMVSLFPELCRCIDEGHFYIACAQGLHRTDCALCLYWVFYAADKGIAPPAIRGYRKDQGHTTEIIMRVLNSYYKYVTESTGTTPISQENFKSRKDIIDQQSKLVKD